MHSDDPRPPEPQEPDLNDCCGNGCDPCVFDTYIQEKRDWEHAVDAWEKHRRQPTTDTGSD